jgi:hypothetical protein
VTHDELLAKIDTHPTKYIESALRAVVELHKPDSSLAPESLKYCTCEEIYPCPTIQAIEKELG